MKKNKLYQVLVLLPTAAAISVQEPGPSGNQPGERNSVFIGGGRGKMQSP